MGVRVFSRLKERMSLNEACVCVCVCPPKCVCASARMGAEMPRKAFECQRQRSRGNWREVTWKRQIKNSWLLLSNISPPFGFSASLLKQEPCWWWHGAESVSLRLQWLKLY